MKQHPESKERMITCALEFTHNTIILLMDERQHFRNCCNLILMLFVSNILFIETETIQKRSVDSRTTQQIEKSTGRSICRIQMFYQNAKISVAEQALLFTFIRVILQHGYKRGRTLVVMPIHHLTLLHIYFLFISIVSFLINNSRWQTYLIFLLPAIFPTIITL